MLNQYVSNLYDVGPNGRAWYRTITIVVFNRLLYLKYLKKRDIIFLDKDPVN